MAYPNVALPATQHSVWYSHTISVFGVAIGSFERMSVRSSRQGVERIREIYQVGGFGAEVKEIVWGGTDTSVDLSRVELYANSIFDVLGSPLYALEQINFPVQITEAQYRQPEGTSGTPVVATPTVHRTVVYEDCVASDWSKDIDTGTTRMVESMTFQVRRVYGRAGA